MESRGVCLRKVGLSDTYLGSYGKYLSTFEIRREREFECKISNGDIVGLFRAEVRLEGEPIETGIVNKWVEGGIQIAFENVVEAVKY